MFARARATAPFRGASGAAQEQVSTSESDTSRGQSSEGTSIIRTKMNGNHSTEDEHAVSPASSSNGQGKVLAGQKRPSATHIDSNGAPPERAFIDPHVENQAIDEEDRWEGEGETRERDSFESHGDFWWGKRDELAKAFDTGIADAIAVLKRIPHMESERKALERFLRDNQQQE